MLNQILLKQKLSDIRDYLEELLPTLKQESRTIIDNKKDLRSVERLFQLVVDSAIDINTHIIRESDFSAPNDFQSTFIILADNKIFSMDFALKIAPSVGLRNLLVHKYGKVDIKKMVDDMKNEIGDYIEYVKLVSEKFS